MIQLVINSVLLREIDERKLINAYARLMYEDISSVESDETIRNNILNLLDWDYAGNKGLEIFCSRFEKIKRKDLDLLISFIKSNGKEIKNIASKYIKNKKLERNKKILDERAKKELKYKENLINKGNDYKPNRGKKAKPCTYEGRKYKSVKECMFKENLKRSEVYKYLVLTGQMNPNSPLAKKYLK